MQRNRGGLSRRQRWSQPCVGIPQSSTAAPRPHPPRGHSTCAAAPHRLGSRDGTLAGRRVPPARGHAVCACRRRQPPSPHTGCRRSQRRSRCGGRTPRRAARLQAGGRAGRQEGGRAGRQAGAQVRREGEGVWHVGRAGKGGASKGRTTTGGRGGQAGRQRWAGFARRGVCRWCAKRACIIDNMQQAHTAALPCPLLPACCSTMSTPAHMQQYTHAGSQQASLCT